MGQRVTGGVMICAVFRNHELSAAYTCLMETGRAKGVGRFFWKCQKVENSWLWPYLIRSAAT